jgi:ribosomal protein S27AE
MANLPPFSGDRPTCPKCGNVGARTEYVSPSLRCSHPGEVRSPYALTTERLHRECGRCDYAWDEATIEQKPPVSAQQPGEAAR